jgi:hypothetical protein
MGCSDLISAHEASLSGGASSPLGWLGPAWRMFRDLAAVPVEDLTSPEPRIADPPFG